MTGQDIGLEIANFWVGIHVGLIINWSAVY